jgi:hypothetical protein
MIESFYIFGCHFFMNGTHPVQIQVLNLDLRSILLNTNRNMDILTEKIQYLINSIHQVNLRLLGNDPKGENDEDN